MQYHTCVNYMQIPQHWKRFGWILKQIGWYPWIPSCTSFPEAWGVTARNMPCCIYHTDLHLNEENLTCKIKNRYFNSLWPTDIIRRQISWSALAQVMSCCLIAPSHYLNQCRLNVISEGLWCSPNGNFTDGAQDINSYKSGLNAEIPSAA